MSDDKQPEEVKEKTSPNTEVEASPDAEAKTGEVPKGNDDAVETEKEQKQEDAGSAETPSDTPEKEVEPEASQEGTVEEAEPVTVENETKPSDETEAAEPQETEEAPVAEDKKEDPLANLKINIDEKTNQIFVLHGSDKKRNSQVIDALKGFGLEPVNLKGAQFESKTLQQKSAELQGIQFAVAILAFDNFVYGKDQKPADAIFQSDQTIVFELGYWLSKLGRDKVFILYPNKPKFKQPSGFFDAIYCPFDDENAWCSELKRRLTNAGYEIT